MNPERFAQIKELLLTVRHLPESERTDYLDKACAGDPSLREEVESLLSHDPRTPSIVRTGGIAGRVPESLIEAVGDDTPLPDSIGPYRVLGILGEGGMGVVYRAQQTQPIQREVAVKLIRRGMDTERVVARFEAERRALALMDHPGIATVLDAGADDSGRPYFVMELVQGVPLLDYADMNILNVASRLKLFIRVCQAVQHAHQRGIIHRDLKPSNVLVTEKDGEPVPKIIDFGIAKAVEEPLTGRSLFTEEGQMVGTPEYMSPEQAGATHDGVDTRTDVYSLGVILYELLTGRRPYRFERHVLQEIQRVIGEEIPERPSTAVIRTDPEDGDTRGVSGTRNTTVDRLRRELAGDLDNIILMSLRKEPERRYPSVEQFIEDIRRYQNRLPVRARKDTWSYRSSKFIRRNRVGVGVVAAGVIMLVGFAATMAIQSARVARERDRAIVAEQQAKLEAETANRVSDFLAELFQTADPWSAQGDSVTAREILDRGAERIGSDLRGQPRIQGALMNTMSRAYSGLRLRDQAMSLAQQSLDIHRREYGDHHEKVAESLQHLGAANATKGDHEKAMEHYRAAMEMQIDLLGPVHEDVGQTASLLALALHTKTQFAEAESLYRFSLGVAQQNHTDDAPAVLDAMGNMAGILHAQGKVDEAEPILLEILEKVEGDSTQRILAADTMSELAVILKVKGELDRAEPYYLGALEIRQEMFGDHPITAQSHNNLGVFLRNRDDLERAETHLRKALEIHLNIRGPHHTDVGIAHANLAGVLDKANRGRDAEEHYRLALEAIEHSQGKDYWVYGQIMYNLGKSFRKSGDLVQARDRMRFGYEGLRDGLGEHHRRTLVALRNLIEVYEELGNTGKAEEYRALLPPEEEKD